MKTGPSPFLIVSDFDDTLKITHTTNRLKTVLRGLFTKQAYAGMPELYQEWSEGHPFVLLSSSPHLIEGKIGRFLDRNGFPPREIWLRDWLKQKDIRRYKTETLRRLESRKDTKIIFVGDDAEYDPEVFSSYREKNPNQVLAIYIRRMRGRPLPEGVTPFHSALEVALSELALGRLKIPQVSRIGKAIIDEKVEDLIIPYFAAPPVDVLLPEHYPTLERVVEHLNSRYAKIRRSRAGA